MRLRNIKNKEEILNNIGIEKYDSVIARAIKKIDEHEINNLKLIRIDANELNDVFNKEIDLIYLTFSDPWPKDRHAKRRLSHSDFLKIYDDIFKNYKKIEMKTDNRKLFEYSVVSFSKYGYVIEQISTDLHKDEENIITTEYEDKFVKLGLPIYKVICLKK